MPIDLVKKNKKQKTVNLKGRRGFNHKNREKTEPQNKISLEEKLEQRFAHLPSMAQKQKIKMMWALVIGFTSLVVMAWFYLASQGVMFSPQQVDTEKSDDDLLQLSDEITNSFQAFKNKLNQQKDVIVSLKEQLEETAAKNALVESLKNSLEEQIGDEQEIASEPDYENWNEYQDQIGEVNFKYPKELTQSEDLGQVAFRAEDPDGFSFYFFTIEPEIGDLARWVEESSVNLEEKIVISEKKSFGDAVDGVYYEATTTPPIRGETSSSPLIGGVGGVSRGYIFNHYGATYSLRSNKDKFPNTFKNILNSIEFKTQELGTQEEEELRQEFLEKYLE